MRNCAILIVDDDREFRETMAKKLGKRGIQCGVAADGDEALTQVANTEYDVVLLDVQMPGKDGITTLRELKQISPLTEVMLLTGHASMETGIDGIKFGAFDYLIKPIDTEQLLAQLDAACKRKKAQQKKIGQAQNTRG